MHTRVNTDTDGGQIIPQVTALIDGGYVIIWVNNFDTGSQVMGQRFAADGTAIGSEIAFDIHNVNASDLSVIALEGGGFALGWTDTSVTHIDNSTGVARTLWDYPGYFQMFSADGTPAGAVIETIDSVNDMAMVALAGGGFAAYLVRHVDGEPEGKSQTFLEIYAADGTRTTQIPGTATTNSWIYSTLTALDGGDFLLTTTERTTSGSNMDVTIQRYHADGTEAGPKALVVHTSYYTYVAAVQTVELDAGRYAVGWWINSYSDNYDCYLRFYNADGTPAGGVDEIAADKPFVLTALQDGRYMVFWGAVGADTRQAQIYDPDGDAVGPQFTIDTDGAYTPAATMLDDGNVVLTWQTSDDIYQNNLHVQFGDGTTNILVGAVRDDIAFGAGGNDTITGLGGNDVIAGDGGNDILSGGADDDLIAGGSGNDVIDGGDGIDTLTFERATRSIEIDLKILTAQGTGEGTDTISHIENIIGSKSKDIITGDAGDNAIEGRKGNDILDGGDGDDIIDGGIGNDTIFFSNGNDRLNGGDDGDDTLSLINAAYGVTIRLDDTGPQQTGLYTTYVLGIQNIIGSDYNDVLIGKDGDEASDTVGSDYDDKDGSKLYGGAGDDTISGGRDGDYIDGGDGIDTLSFANSNSYYISANLGTTGLQRTDDDKDIILNMENIIGSARDDRFTGSSVGNVLDGRAGNDELRGGGGKDTLIGGTGDDRIDGDGGADWLYGNDGDDRIMGDTGSDLIDGGDGIDTLDYSDAADGIRTNLAVTSVQGTRQGNDTILNIENVTGSIFYDRIGGDAGANVLSGGNGNDVINGNRGSDTLLGGNGDDLIMGGTGSDIINGGAGIDTLSFANTGNGIRINLAQTASQGTMEGNDTITNIENVIGSRFDDRIAGNGGSNVLTGGLGADLFLFAIGSGNDRISDFSAAQNDRIDVSAYDRNSAPVVTQHGADAWIDLGGGNVIVVANTTSTDSAFLSHIIW